MNLIRSKCLSFSMMLHSTIAKHKIEEQESLASLLWQEPTMSYRNFTNKTVLCLRKVIFFLPLHRKNMCRKVGLSWEIVKWTRSPELVSVPGHLEQVTTHRSWLARSLRPHCMCVTQLQPEGSQPP